jgi:hypothetical protein
VASVPASRDREAERRLAKQIAAHEKWSKQDPSAGTQAARDAFNQRFLRQVDPDGVLDEPERRRRAWHARRAYFARLSLASAKARRARRGAKGTL